MCSTTVSQVLRAIDARIGLVVIRTSNEKDLFDSLSRVLVEARGHLLWEYQDASGVRPLAYPKGEGSLPLVWQEWRKDNVGSPNAALYDFRQMKVQDSDPHQYCLKHKLVWSRTHPKGCPSTCTELPALCHRTFIMRGILPYLSEQTGEPNFVRNLLESAHQNMPTNSNLLLFLEPNATLPEELSRVSIIIDDRLPTRKEIAAKWKEFCSHVKDAPRRRILLEGVPYETHAVVESVVNRLTGLSAPEIRNALTMASTLALAPPEGELFPLFLQALSEKKTEALKKSSALEVHTPHAAWELGGLDQLQKWIRIRASTLTPEARAAGIPLPRGILLLGIPGAGKSLCAKVCASILNLPLYSLDFGALFGKYVGDSESNIRTALATVEAAAPCALMVN